MKEDWPPDYLVPAMFVGVFLLNYFFWYRSGLYALKKWAEENGYELIDSKFANIRFTMGPYSDMFWSKAPTYKIRVIDQKTREEKIGWFRAGRVMFSYSTKGARIIWDEK